MIETYIEEDSYQIGWAEFENLRLVDKNFFEKNPFKVLSQITLNINRPIRRTSLDVV